MNIRRLVLDVDMALTRPTVVDLAAAIELLPGIEAVNIKVTEVDLATVGMEITIEGQNINYDVVPKAIESAGAVVNCIDQNASEELHALIDQTRGKASLI